MKVDRVVRDESKALRQVLEGLDHHLTARDNFAPEGQQGWVLTSRGPDQIPVYAPVALSPETGVNWSAITGTPNTLAGYGIENAYTVAQVNALIESHTHPAADIVSGILDPSRLGSGASGESTYLRGDNTWQPRSLAGLGIAGEVASHLAVSALKEVEGPDDWPSMIPGAKGDIGPVGPPGAPGFGTINNIQLLQEEYHEDVWSVPGPSGSAGSPGAAGVAGLMGNPGIDGEPGEDGYTIPGATGPRGFQGERGAPGEAAEPDDWSFVIPGPAGAVGVAGAAGVAGSPGVPGMDGEADDWGWMIPGPQGRQGSIGGSGTVGKIPKYGPTTTNITDSIMSEAASVITVGSNVSPSGTSLAINAVAGGDRDFLYYSAGSLRWVLRTNSDAESGANAGSNFDIIRRSDAGALIDAPLRINRASGIVSLPVGLVVGSSGAPDATSVVLNTAVGAYSNIRFLRNDLSRWIWEVDDVAESGGNVGTDMNLYRYNDAGAGGTLNFKIRRVEGDWLFGESTMKLLKVDDTGRLAISGGSVFSTTNGAFVQLFGSSAAAGNRGTLFLQAGNPGTPLTDDGTVLLQSGNVNRWQLNVGGMLLPYADVSYDLGLTGNRVRTLYVTKVSDGAAATGETLGSVSTTLNIGAGTSWATLIFFTAGVNRFQLQAAGASFSVPVISPGSNMKAADQATFANAQTNIALGSFAIGLNQTWVVDCFLPITMVGTGGVKFYFTGPAGATGEVTEVGTGALLTTVESVYTAAITVPGTFLHRVAGAGHIKVRANIRSAGTAGTIQLVGITSAAGVTCLVKKGFNMLAERIT